MTEQSRTGGDRWSTWLTTERFGGQDSAAGQASGDLLASIRDRVLAGARLWPGARVVDLGAGTGLLTTGAIEQVGPTGAVIAIDVSHAALCALHATTTSVYPLVGDARHIPLADAVADAVVVRSVLIYLTNLAGAFTEVARILRPGGRLSVFEPINADRHHDACLRGLTEHELTAIQQLREQATPEARPMLAFTEDTAVESAEQAGLTVDDLHRCTVTDQLVDRSAVDAYLNRRPHPGAPAPLDHIRTRLGPTTASRYEHAWHRAVAEQGPITFTTPVVFMAAIRSGRR